jgi:hypothetical protein
MKIELGKKGVSVMPIAQFILIVFMAMASQAAAYAGGIRDRNTEPAADIEMKQFLWEDPSPRPEWVDIVPQSATEFYFVGTSQPYDTAANARDNARENARNQVLSFYGQFIERRAIESGSMSGSTRDTLEVFVAREEEIRSYAEHVISQIGMDRYYTRVYLNSNNQEEYVVYVLSQISRQKAEEDIANFARNISQRYVAMVVQRSTLKATLEGYVTVLRALEQNTLHRVTAYYDASTGRVGLYGYVQARISELANSVFITSLQNRTVRKTDNLDTVVRVQSALIPDIGQFDFRVSITGMNINIPVQHYTIADNNSFPMTFFTTPLEPGRYTVQIVMLLDEVTGGIARNISSGFSFEVTPLTVVYRDMTEIEAGIKRAVDTLAAGLQNQTETRIGPFTLTETDIPTGLSLFLTERVTHHAISNIERRYRVIRDNIERESEQIASLAGFFTQRGEQVDITLELNTPDGVKGSQFFSISADVLAGLGIAIHPENINILPEEPFIEPQVNQRINIQAFFNSESRTFFHRDELGMTLMADRNCYFKVIHIDANNQMTMIYPNSADRNNFLRANMPRAIFETARAFLYEPYGAETIIVVASAEQFRDIEQNLVTPLMPATAASVRTAVRGRQGNESDGEAVYTITILQPHEKFEYRRPENMREMVETLRRDVLSQGGTFEGNEISGVYIVNGVRGSYRLPRDRPDIIQFAIYYTDNFTGGPLAGVQTRGRGFNFSFPRPANITHAVQTVQTSIVEKGGTFSGNEQQGNFHASGIAGQYRVTDLVNVTITEKPFMIPNSLIEREVRIFFGVR